MRQKIQGAQKVREGVSGLSIKEVIRKIFEPKSVAVVGVRKDTRNPGYEVLKNIVRMGFKGELYAIGPANIGRELGVPTYSSVSELPEGVELAIVSVPTEEVPKVVEELGARGVRVVIILSRGFSETGRTSKRDLEDRVLEAARKHGIRVLGPGSQGVGNPSKYFYASWPLVKEQGPLAIVSRSGAIASTLIAWAVEEGLGISKLATLGNKADLDEVDILEYLAEDDESKSIALYIEAVRDGRRLMKVLEKTTLRKPVVALKSGRTRSGAFAVASRLGMPAGHYRLYLEAFRKTGVLPATSLEELYDMWKGLALLPLVRGSNVQIITTSIGAGVILADALEELGLRLAKTSPEVKRILRRRVSEYSLISNPLNLPRDASESEINSAIEEVMKDQRVDIVMIVLAGMTLKASSSLAKWRGSEDKALIPVLLGASKDEIMDLQKQGIPVYVTPERGARVAAALARYSSYLRFVSKLSEPID